METLPGVCQPIARLLTTQRQLENVADSCDLLE